MKPTIPSLILSFLAGCGPAVQAKAPAEEFSLREQAERIMQLVPEDNHYHYSGWPYWVVVTADKEKGGLQFDMFSKYLQDKSFRFIDRTPLGNADEVLFCDKKNICERMNLEKNFINDTYLTLCTVTEDAFAGTRDLQLEDDLKKRYNTLREIMSLFKEYSKSGNPEMSRNGGY